MKFRSAFAETVEHNMITKRLQFVLAWMVAGLVLLAILILKRSADRTGIDPKTLERFLQIEAGRNQLDETVWGQEMLAQKYEDIFIQLWDQLRAAADPFSILRNFSFGELRLGEPQPSRLHELGITEVEFSGSTRSMALEDWRSWLDRAKEEGYRLDQSEWRLVAFERTNEVARAFIDMNLHASLPANQRRIILRGKLDVRWRPSQDLSVRSDPDVISVAALRVLSRDGPAVFEHVLSQEIAPELNSVFIDPMILYDLDRDNRSEILFATRNRIYWNRGQGEFHAAPISTALSDPINVAMVADFNMDARPDFLAADSLGLLMLTGDAQGRFSQVLERTWRAESPLLNPFVMTAGDIDGDGDLDVWLAQYKLPYVEGQMPTPFYDGNDGFPSFLLVNDGSGRFSEQTERAGLSGKRLRRTYSSSFVDLDSDKDLDLVVVSDFAGMDVYSNDGRGRFTDATSMWVDDSHAFGMAHAIADLDRDLRPDIFMIGMNSFVADRLDYMGLGISGGTQDLKMRPKMAYGNRLYFWDGQQFRQKPMSEQAAKSGWSWGVSTFDFDLDGDLDAYIANGHKSRATAKDYEAQFWRHDIYVGGSAHDSGVNLYFGSVARRLYGLGYSYGGYYKNAFFLNEAGASFLEVAHLLGVALEVDSRNVASDDLDGDGRLDLILTTFEEWPRARQAVHLFRNTLSSPGHWLAVRLRESGRGRSPAGAKVILKSPAGSQVRFLVTGDSYRTQHAPTAHFGIGNETQVNEVEVHWPNGEIERIQNPGVDQAHVIGN